MSGSVLLDTNIIIAFFARDASVHEHMVNAKEIFIPSVAIGELYFGAYKSLKVQDNIVRIDKFARNSVILPCNTDTAKIYGKIKSRLKEKGQLIPENDIWVAAIAQQHTLTLVTRDVHFNAVENLKVELW